MKKKSAYGLHFIGCTVVAKLSPFWLLSCLQFIIIFFGENVSRVSFLVKKPFFSLLAIYFSENVPMTRFHLAKQEQEERRIQSRRCKCLIPYNFLWYTVSVLRTLWWYCTIEQEQDISIHRQRFLWQQCFYPIKWRMCVCAQRKFTRFDKKKVENCTFGFGFANQHSLISHKSAPINPPHLL